MIFLKTIKIWKEYFLTLYFTNTVSHMLASYYNTRKPFFKEYWFYYVQNAVHNWKWCLWGVCSVFGINVPLFIKFYLIKCNKIYEKSLVHSFFSLHQKSSILTGYLLDIPNYHLIKEWSYKLVITIYNDVYKQVHRTHFSFIFDMK